MHKIKFGPIRMNIAMFIFQSVCNLEQFVIPTKMADVYTCVQEWCLPGLGTGWMSYLLCLKNWWEWKTAFQKVRQSRPWKYLVFSAWNSRL